MKNNRTTYAKNILLPCLVFSGLTGIFTGSLIFLFKLTANKVISFSSDIYTYVRENPVFLPLLILGTAAVGLIASFILSKVPDSRGGGIPSAIAFVRGLVPFHWLKSVVFVFISAMLTYLCGVPLGNEGPSVQMGTAVGRGTVRIFGKKNAAWDRYIMTGGACAGFAAATCSPIAGLFFAFEEAHNRFSPMIFMTASMTVITSTATTKILCGAAGMEFSLFGFSLEAILPLNFFWAAIIIGVICGLSACAFAKLHGIFRTLLKKKMKKVPLAVKVVTIFAAVSVIGFFSADCIGSGHDLVHHLLEGHGVWYLLILFFCIRALLLIIANNADITGGLFVPTLAFGAILGDVCGEAMIAAGILPAEYYAVMVVIGIVSFLSASSRIPIMALVFGVEAFAGLPNILPLFIGVTFAYLTIETLGIVDFSDTVIEAKVEAAHEGKTAQIVDTHLTVSANSFAIGKEIRDILWPPTCVVLSIHKNPALSKHAGGGISEGDVLHLHYQTYDPEETLQNLIALVGDQTENLHATIHAGDENDHVPE